MQVLHSIWDTETFYIRSLPPSCLGLHPGPMAAPSRLVHSFVNIAVNTLVHSGLDGVSLQPARRGRKPKKVPLHEQFLSALTSKETVLSASASELVSLSLKLNSWTAQIQPEIENVPFRTCFRLEAPGIEDATWWLAFFRQANDDRSLLVPAKEVWQTKSRALNFLRKRLKNPQELVRLHSRRPLGNAKINQLFIFSVHTNHTPLQPPSSL